MIKTKIKLIPFALILSIVNLVLFHYSFFKFVFNHFDSLSGNGLLLIPAMLVIAVALNALLFGTLLYISPYVGKTLIVLCFVLNALATYFVLSYGVIIDESMIGNVLNTNTQEAGSFFSYALLLYLFVVGILPSIYVIRTEYTKPSAKKFFSTAGLTLALIATLLFVNAANWLWIDKYAKQLG